MTQQEVEQELMRDPFVPLRLHLKNGKNFDVPFREVARVIPFGVFLLIGLKKGTRQAKSFERFRFDQIDRIEQRPAKGRRKKAS